MPPQLEATGWSSRSFAGFGSSHGKSEAGGQRYKYYCDRVHGTPVQWTMLHALTSAIIHKPQPLLECKKEVTIVGSGAATDV
jgi:hypothetical protein